MSDVRLERKEVSVAFCALGSFFPTLLFTRLKSAPTALFFFLNLGMVARLHYHTSTKGALYTNRHALAGPATVTAAASPPPRRAAPPPERAWCRSQRGSRGELQGAANQETRIDHKYF